MQKYSIWFCYHEGTWKQVTFNYPTALDCRQGFKVLKDFCKQFRGRCFFDDYEIIVPEWIWAEWEEIEE